MRVTTKGLNNYLYYFGGFLILRKVSGLKVYRALQGLSMGV